jgi:hypothetical protein
MEAIIPTGSSRAGQETGGELKTSKGREELSEQRNGTEWANLCLTFRTTPELLPQRHKRLCVEGGFLSQVLVSPLASTVLWQ